MAAGDAVASTSITVTAGATVTIQPSAGVEWTIFNVYAPVAASIEVYRTDGTNPILIDSNALGGIFNNFWRCTNTSYLSVKNTGVSSIYIYYDGTQTK
jgi:hypothetical protein